MEIWITREQTGILLQKYAAPDEIEEDLRGLQIYEALSPKEPVKVELSGPWEEIKQVFRDIQLLAAFVRKLNFEKGSEPDRLIKRFMDSKLIEPLE